MRRDVRTWDVACGTGELMDLQLLGKRVFFSDQAFNQTLVFLVYEHQAWPFASRDSYLDIATRLTFFQIVVIVISPQICWPV